MQRSIEFDPQILSIEGPAYLVGAWQSERYFVAVQDTIRKDLELLDAPSGNNADSLKMLKSQTSVAVHIRRGDYVSDPHLSKFYNVCTPQYYNAARATIEGLVYGARYFVFSDDIAWAKDSFRHWTHTTFVDHNRPEERHEDLRLMAACKHFIIANSSFSWWAAWLADNAKKVVVSPEVWATNQTRETMRDVLPEGWLRLAV